MTFNNKNGFPVELSVRGVHTVVVVEVPHKPSECQIILVGTGGELPVKGLCNRLLVGLGFSLEGD